MVLCALGFLIVEQHLPSLYFSPSKLRVSGHPHTVSSLHIYAYVNPSVYLSCFKIILLYSKAFPCASTGVGACFVFSLSLVQEAFFLSWSSNLFLCKRLLGDMGHFTLSLLSIPSFRRWPIMDTQIDKPCAR